MAVYHHYPRSSVRPNRFRLTQGHPLWNDCVYAGFAELGGNSLELRDSSISHGTGTFQAMNESAWRIAKGRRGLYFNGSSQWVNTNLSWVHNGPITVCCWGSFPATSAHRGAWGGYNTDYANAVCSLRLPAYDVISWYYGGSVDGTVSISSSPYVNTLNHYGCVSEGQGGSYQALYVNGEVGASRNDPLGPALVPVEFDIGRSQHSETFWRYHVGDLFDVVRWHRVLSQDEIRLVGGPDPMLGGALEKYPTQTIFIPSAAAVSPITSPFESVIFGA